MVVTLLAMGIVTVAVIQVVQGQTEVVVGLAMFV